MGGRGGSGGLNGGARGHKDYTPYQPGRITKYEAGAVYKAVKNGDITARPETTRELYDSAERRGTYQGQYQEAYSRDHLYYDRIYRATSAIINGDFKRAQKEIKAWEESNIGIATRKSAWYKYKK